MITNEYHLAELAIALKPCDPRHVNPPPQPVSKKVLDIGCGVGQTLIANYPDRVTYGLDIDPEALALGTRIAHNVRFAQGAAEHLPFSAGQFDLVVSRVTIPYTRIHRSLKEVHRVLKPGGELWMTLHSFSTVLRSHNWRSLRSKISLGYVVANSLLFYVCQKQFSVIGKCESFQTTGGIRRALEQTDFVGIETKVGKHFIVQARVPVVKPVPSGPYDVPTRPLLREPSIQSSHHRLSAGLIRGDS